MLFSRIFFCFIALACCPPNNATESLPCKVPVFRYALEHWRPDPYEVAILYRGSLSSESESLVAMLEEAGADGSQFANLNIARLDVATVGPTELLDEVLGPGFRDAIESPEIVLLYPEDSSSGPLVWRGPLNSANVDALLNSPARREITQWILDGESVVWVLVGAGDATKDGVAQQTLQTEIARLEKTIKMRDIEVIESEKQFGSDSKVELRLGIKLLVLDRNNPEEEIFAAMLARSEVDLEELNEPFAIPVFGRGRAHLSLSGKGINPKMIETTCRFLIGDCSCEVKRLNPGVDLLFAVNWDDYFFGTAENVESQSELTGIAEYVEVAPGHVSVQAPTVVGTSSAEEEVADISILSTRSRMPLIVGMIVLGFVVIVITVSLRSQMRT